MLNTEEINHIRSSVNIVDVISTYLPLTQRGKNYFGVCPFHDDHSPSMSVSKDRQIYKCFSCGATGNVFTFLMDYEHITFLEAIKKVADLAGIPIQVGIPTKTQNKNLEVLYEIYDFASKYYQNHIHTSMGKEAKEYLEKRKIDASVIKEFGIGLSPNDNNVLTNLLLEKKYSNKDLIRSGLIAKNEYGLHDIYKNRIMFPLWDLNGNIVGFSGRVFHGEKESKYINTMETEIFHKGDLIYNYHRAKDSARNENTILIMEGFMDVIRASTIGIHNVVAMMGTAVTKNQANLIKRMAKNIILCFDGDEAGAKATYSCGNELLELGITPKVIRLEENLDPDEYIQKYGKERFLEKIQNPINIMDFKLSYLKKNMDLTSSVDLANYVNHSILELSKIEDDVLREISLKKISEESHLEIDFLKERLKQLPKKKVEPKKKEKKVSKNKYELAETYLLFYMLRDVKVIQMYQESGVYFPTEKYRLFGRLISAYYRENESIDVADFISFIEGDEASLSVLKELNALSLKEQFEKEEIEDYIHTLKEQNIDAEIQRLQEKMKQTDNQKEKVTFAQKIVEWNLKKRREEYDK